MMFRVRNTTASAAGRQKYPRAHGPDRARNGPVALQGRGPSRRWLPGWLCEVSHAPPNAGNDSIVATSEAPCTSVADEVIESRLSCLRQEVLNVNFATGCP